MPRVLRVGNSSPTAYTLDCSPGAYTITGKTAAFDYSGVVNWTFDDDSELSTVADTTDVLATDVPTGATAYMSPDPLPGQTLELSSNTLSLVGDSTVPPADITRDFIIEVMDSEHATAQIMRTGEMFGLGAAGANVNIQKAMERMQDGDTLQISPGSIWLPGNSDGSGYLEGSCFAVYKSVTIMGIPGRGRWRLAPQSTTYTPNYSGIVIREPNQTYSNVGDTVQSNNRKEIVIQDFDFNNWGILAGDKGIRIRTMATDGSTYNNMHESVTLSNFKLGKLPGYTSGSGISGEAETLILLDGHVYDCGDGSGQEHNLYCSGVNLTMRGIRVNRTRGWSGTPYAGTETLEGHLCKISAANGTIEGCAIYASADSDCSQLIQMKAGGNWIVRSNLIVDSVFPNNANGAINMCRETPSVGIHNFDWWAGLEGNSLLFEKNVYIGHFPRPILWFFDTSNINALQASGWGVAEERLDSLIVRDNIAMVTDTDTTGFMIAGFPGTNNSKWINNDPNAGTYWSARGNIVETYDVDEEAFADRLLKIYTRVAGPLAASTGTLDTYRFTWPHGSEARTDAYRGLG